MPNLPDIVRGPARFGRRATAGDMGGFEAEANAQRGVAVSELAETTQRLYEAHEQSKRDRLEAEGRVAMSDLVFELAKDPDFKTHEERFEEGYAEIQKKSQSQLMPGSSQAEFATRMKIVGEMGRSRVRVNTRRLQLNEIRGNFDATEQRMIEEAARAKTPQEAAEIQKRHSEMARDRVRSGALTLPEAVARETAFPKSVAAIVEKEARVAKAAATAAEKREKDPLSLKVTLLFDLSIGFLNFTKAFCCKICKFLRKTF